MPNRIIKESICTSDSLDGLSWFEEVLFYRLIVNCDDFGRYDGRPSVIKNRLFPLKDDESLTKKAVSSAISGLEQAGLIVRYESDGKPYLFLPTWNKHQTISAKKSKYPAPVEHVQASEIICKQMQADESICKQMNANVPVIQSNPIQIQSYSEYENEKEIADKPQRATAFKPPTVEEVKEYCDERNNGIDPQAFVDFYNATNWNRGKSKIKDWKACVRVWEQRDKESPPKERRPSKTTTAAEYKAPTPKSLEDLQRVVDMI